MTKQGKVRILQDNRIVFSGPSFGIATLDCLWPIIDLFFFSILIISLLLYKIKMTKCNTIGRTFTTIYIKKKIDNFGFELFITIKIEKVWKNQYTLIYNYIEAL